MEISGVNLAIVHRKIKRKIKVDGEQKEGGDDETELPEETAEEPANEEPKKAGKSKKAKKDAVEAVAPPAKGKGRGKNGKNVKATA
jgi:hypothetical protein